MNREQRRKNKITYTKQSLMDSYKEGYTKGFEKGIEAASREILGTLRKDFGFGRKRLARVYEGIKKEG